MAHRFDELVKALADARSRREMLKLLGVSLMGTLTTFGRPQDVLADNSACALFCNAVFPPGPERGRCKSEAAQGRGLCIECGADPDRVCGADGELVCCEEGEICIDVNDSSVCVSVNYT